MMAIIHGHNAAVGSEAIRVLASRMPDILKFKCLTELRPENYKGGYISIDDNQLYSGLPRIWKKNTHL
jgi:hypothetical protein